MDIARDSIGKEAKFRKVDHGLGKNMSKKWSQHIRIYTVTRTYSDVFIYVHVSKLNGSCRFERYVSECHKEHMKREGKPEQLLADMDAEEALDMLSAQGKWAQCLDVARPHGQVVLHKYIALYAADLLRVTAEMTFIVRHGLFFGFGFFSYVSPTLRNPKLADHKEYFPLTYSLFTYTVVE